MIQKPALKNGQKYVHDATSKTSSAESQQQQQRKVERASHVQDVAKQPNGPGVNGNGGYHHSASHGATSGYVDNGRGNQQANGANGVAPVHAAHNGYQGRANGNGHIGPKPGHAANGHAVPARPPPYGGGFKSSAAKPGGKPSSYGHGGAIGVNYHPHVNATTVQSAAFGGRRRDASAVAGPYPNGGPAAAGNSTGVSCPDGVAGGRARDPRRRGGRGRGGGAGGEGASGGADASADDGNMEGGAPGSITERQERYGRPRGGRRQRSGGLEVADAEGCVIGESAGSAGANAAHVGNAAPEQGDAERGGQRSGRARGRRGRGGQGAGAPEQGDQGDEAADLQRQPAPRPQQTTDAADQLQERKPRQQRQRPIKEPRQPEQEGVPQSTTREQLQPSAADGQQHIVGARLLRPRKVKEPRPSLSQQPPKQRSQGPEASELVGDDVARGGTRGQDRSGKRRNGEGPEAAGPAGGVQVVPTAPGGQADGDIAGGRRQKPPRPPRHQQSQSVEQSLPVQPQQPVEQPPAPSASQLQYQPPPPPMQLVPAAHLPQEQPAVQQQQQYQQPAFQDGQSLVDYPPQMLQHVVPQHQYPPPQDYHQQQHFLQQHQLLQHQQPQFEHSFQQFQQHQQLMQQHMAPPVHSYLAGPFNPPGGPIGGPPPMPNFYASAENAYGQMLPEPTAFGGAPTPPMSQAGAVAAVSVASGQQMLPPGVVPHELQHQVLQQQHDAHLNVQMAPSSSQQQLAVRPVEPPCAPPVSVVPEVAVVSALVEPDPPVAPDPVQEAPSAEPVKNEWADRLAQQALARMNAVKSSLITGSSALSEGLSSAAGIDERPRGGTQVPPLGRPSTFSSSSVQGSGTYTPSPRGPPPSGGAYATESETWRLGYGDSDGGGRRTAVAALNAAEAWRSAAPSGGSAVVGDASNGWRSSLAPTGVANAAEAWRMRGAAAEEAEVQAPAPYQPQRREESPPPPLGAAGAAGRPRLNLQPRTKPVPATSEPAARPAAPAAAQPAAAHGEAPVANGPSGVGTVVRASIFGAARPREEVLRERGHNEPAERLTTAYTSAYTAGSAAGSGAGRVGGRAGSVTSGASDEDQWQTVGKGGRSKPPPPGSADVGNALLDATSDPFFTGRATTGHGVAIVGRSIPTGRVYGVNGGHFGGSSYGKGSHGSHGGDTYMNAFGASRDYGNSYGNDDEPIFKRGLPTRNGDPF